MADPELELKRWTRVEYEKLIDQGVFTSEPEPDVAVVRGDLRDSFTAHPADPVLVVEVTLSSLTLDRRYKSSLYARAGRPEYWVLNLVNHTQKPVKVRLEGPKGPASDLIVASPAGDTLTLQPLEPVLLRFAAP